MIQTIFDLICGAKKPITEAQILKALVKKFPDREESSMKNTIRAQIISKKRPVRMEKEKDVTFTIEGEGKDKTYSL